MKDSFNGTDAMRICLHGCQTSIDPMDLSFQCSAQNQDRYINLKRINTLRCQTYYAISLVGVSNAFKPFFNYKHFSSRMARISNKTLRIFKDLSMFVSENPAT